MMSMLESFCCYNCHVLFIHFLLCILQKEEKIQVIRQKLAERDALKGTGTSRCRQSKQPFIITDYPTGEGTSDSAIGGGISVCTKSSRASASDVEFSETYL